MPLEEMTIAERRAELDKTIDIMLRPSSEERLISSEWPHEIGSDRSETLAIQIVNMCMHIAVSDD